MRIRLQAMWKVPVMGTLASFISWYATIFPGRFFFIVITTGPDGVKEVSADPLRSALFQGCLFLILLLAGGLWLRRSMTRAEIALSAGILSAVYLLLVLLQILLPELLMAAAIPLAMFQNWSGIPAALLAQLTGWGKVSPFLSAAVPLLFIPFGKPSVISE